MCIRIITKLNSCYCVNTVFWNWSKIYKYLCLNWKSKLWPSAPEAVTMKPWTQVKLTLIYLSTEKRFTINLRVVAIIATGCSACRCLLLGSHWCGPLLKEPGAGGCRRVEQQLVRKPTLQQSAEPTHRWLRGSGEIQVNIKLNLVHFKIVFNLNTNKTGKHNLK